MRLPFKKNSDQKTSLATGESEHVVISLLNRLSEKAGGVTKSVIFRSNTLSDAGYMCFIFLLEFDSSIPKTVNKMKSDKRISDFVGIKSFFSHYACASLNIERVSYDVKMKRVFNHVGATGMCLVRYYNSKDIIFAEELLDASRNGVYFSLFINGEARNFNSKVEAQTEWLDAVCDEFKSVTLFSDQTNAPERVANVTAKNTKKVLQVHGNHYDSPYKAGAKIKGSYKKVFSLMGHYHAVLVLTGSQKSDIIKDVNCRTPVFVNPHPIAIKGEINNNAKDPNLAVVVSRLEKLKGIERIISNFKIVCNSNKDAVLEIWGEGRQASIIAKHIKDLGLSENVKLMGYSLDPFEPMRRASVALFASEQEGFGLALAEAVAQGTPVVSLRTSYGADEIIINGVNGYVVDTDEEYAEKVLNILSVFNGKIFNQKECRESVEWLSPENYLHRISPILSGGEYKVSTDANSPSFTRFFVTSRGFGLIE